MGQRCLGIGSPKALLSLNTVFFYNGKISCWEECKNTTTWLLFSWSSRIARIATHTMSMSKNHQGGVSDSSNEGKDSSSQMDRSRVNLGSALLKGTTFNHAAKPEILSTALPFTPTGNCPSFFNDHLGLNSVQEKWWNTWQRMLLLKGKIYQSQRPCYRHHHTLWCWSARSPHPEVKWTPLN